MFGVGQRTDPFRDLNPQPVALPLQLSPPRLDCGQLWQEPAIARLDWLFTPNPRLEEHLLVEPLQASTKFYLCFTLPKVRSSGFGSYPSDSRHFRTTPLMNCGLVAFALGASCGITLATQINSLARYSKRMIQLRKAVPNYGYQVSGSFYFLSWVLFNVPSLYYLLSDSNCI
jgi:hypothetical protein